MSADIPTLQGNRVFLEPLDFIHAEDLFKLREDRAIFDHLLYGPFEKIEETYTFIYEAKRSADKKHGIPWIIKKPDGKIVGTTRITNISKNHKSAEIGFTFLCSSVHKTGLNIEAKYLILQYAFEKLELLRIQIVTDEKNMASRRGIERLGAKYEGTLYRNHALPKNNYERNTRVYSILASQWPYVKEHNERRLKRFDSQISIKKNEIPSASDVFLATKNLENIIYKTPLITHPILNEIHGSPVYLKLENQQITGSFKFRGAYNALYNLNQEQKQQRVVTSTTGNHGYAIAEAAKKLQMQATIFLPNNAPLYKKMNISSTGAYIQEFDPKEYDGATIAKEYAIEKSLNYIPTWDNKHIISGHGTLLQEIIEQTEQIYHQKNESILTGVGGGSLAAGITLASENYHNPPHLIIVEPENAHDFALSFQKKERTSLAEHNLVWSTIADGLNAEMPAELPWKILHNKNITCIQVSDQEIQKAIQFAAHTLKIIIEPSGAVSLAAVLHKKLPKSSNPITLIITGGNADLTKNNLDEFEKFSGKKIVERERELVY